MNIKIKYHHENNHEISIVKFLEFLFEKSKNKRIDIQMIYYEIISLNFFYDFNIYIKNHFEMIYIFFEKMVKNRFLSKKQKKNISKMLLEMKKNK